MKAQKYKVIKESHPYVFNGDLANIHKRQAAPPGVASVILRVF